MHEMSILVSMLEIINDNMAKNGAKKLIGLQIRIGEMTALEPDALRFCFDACIAGTPLEGAILEIEEVPLTGRCRACNTEYRLEHYFQSVCPGCGSGDFECISGRELDVVSMKIE